MSCTHALFLPAERNLNYSPSYCVKTACILIKRSISILIGSSIWTYPLKVWKSVKLALMWSRCLLISLETLSWTDLFLAAVWGGHYNGRTATFGGRGLLAVASCWFKTPKRSLAILFAFRELNSVIFFSFFDVVSILLIMLPPGSLQLAATQTRFLYNSGAHHLQLIQRILQFITEPSGPRQLRAVCFS